MLPRMPRAGDFDQRVTPLVPTPTEDAAGQQVEALVAQGDVWARVRPLRGGEWLAASAAQSSAELRLQIRYRADVTGRWRWRWKGTEYRAIGEPSDIDGGGHTLEVMLSAAGPAA